MESIQGFEDVGSLSGSVTVRVRRYQSPKRQAQISFFFLQRSGQAGKISCGILRMRKYANFFLYYKGAFMSRVYLEHHANRRRKTESFRGTEGTSKEKNNRECFFANGKAERAQ